MPRFVLFMIRCHARVNRTLAKILITDEHELHRVAIIQLSSTSYCHPYSRSFVFPGSLRIHRLLTVGYVPCAAEKIIGIPYSGLCRGDETTHSLQATVVTHLIVRAQCQPNQRAGTDRHTEPGYLLTGSRPGHAAPDAEGAVLLLP